MGVVVVFEPPNKPEKRSTDRHPPCNLMRRWPLRNNHFQPEHKMKIYAIQFGCHSLDGNANCVCKSRTPSKKKLAMKPLLQIV